MTHPQSFGPYEVIDELGSGGMAVVYRAVNKHLRGSDTRDDASIQVAIKTPRREILSEQLLARFKQEVKALYQLRLKLESDTIVTIDHYDEQDGVPYLVMRYLPGGTLADRLEEKKRYSPEEVLPVIERVARALDHAHRAGILHRDVKPANILFDHAGNACLSDFGIAKITQQDGDHTLPHLTGHGGIPGTPPYVSPEQMRDEPFDHRIDVYALGIVAYEMLAGGVPYKASTPALQASLHVREPIPSIREERPDLPEAIEEFIRRALAKKPDERFQSAGELARAMRVIVYPPRAPVPTQPRGEPTGNEKIQNNLSTPKPNSESNRKTEPEEKDKSSDTTSLYLIIAVSTFVVALIFAVPLYIIRERDKPPIPTRVPTLVESVAIASEPTTTPTLTPIATRTVTPAPPSSPTPTPTPETPTPTLTPSKPTSTATSTATPTPQPDGLAIIVPQNADQLEPLASWGLDAISDIAFSPDGRFLAVAAGNGIYLHDTRSRGAIDHFETDNPPEAIAFAPDSKLLATGMSDGTVEIRRVADGQLLTSLIGHEAEVTSVSFSPDGEKLVSTSWDATVRLWSVDNGKLLATLVREDAATVTSATFSPDGRTLATTGAYTRTVRVLRVEDGEQLFILSGEDVWINQVVFSPDGQMLVAPDINTIIWLWRTEDAGLITVMEGHTGWIMNVAFSPDGRTLASASDDATVRLWSTVDGELLAILPADDGVNQIAFSPDGQILVSVSDDETVRLWHVEGGDLLNTLRYDSKAVWHVDFSPNGRLLASASFRGVQIWGIPTEGKSAP